MAKFIPLSVPNFEGNEKEYVNEAVVSEWVSTGGSKVGEFEEKFARYVGMPTAVACNSGTSALHLAFLAAGIGRGDEVICPALTFIASINPIRYVGAEPVFIGCDDTLCIDPAAVRAFCAEKCEKRADGLYNKATGAHVKALEAVHVFGNFAELEELTDICAEYGLILIEDAAEAVGSRFTAGRFAGRMAGTIGDIGAYSFNGNKIITCGAGGMVVSNHPDWAQHAKHLSTQAKSDELQFKHDEVGYNFRLTNLQAALGLAQLEQLETFIARKKAFYDRYVELLQGKHGFRILPFRDEVGRSNHWFFSLYLQDERLQRDEVLKALKAESIQARPVWALINEQCDYGRNEAYAMEKAQDYRAHIINLPCSTNLTMQDIDRVAQVLLSL